MRPGDHPGPHFFKGGRVEPEQRTTERLKNNFGKTVKRENKPTKTTGISLYDQASESHSVTINGVTYEWTDATVDTVPEEALAVYQRSQEANA